MSQPTPKTYTRDQKIAALDAATKATMDPKNIDQIKQDVGNLIQKTKDIRKGFSDAGLTLDSIDNEKYTDGTPLNDTGKLFYPEWKDLSTRFEKLLMQSCQEAATVGAHFLSFDAVVLKFITDPDALTQEEKLQTVEEFSKTLDDEIKSSSEYEKGFKDLADDVTSFGNRFEGFATARLKSDQAQVTKLQEEIAAAKDMIKGLETAITWYAVAVGITAFVCLVIAIFSVGWGIAIFGAAVSSEIDVIIKYKKIIKNEQDKIDKDNDKIAELNAEIAKIEDAQKKLNDVKSNNITTINSALGTFKGLWQSVFTECSELKGYLSGTIDLPPVIFASYLKQGQSIYKPLGEALISYGKLQDATFSTLHDPMDMYNRLGSIVKWSKVNPAVEKAVRELFKYAELPVIS